MRAARKKRGLTQEQVAGRVGLAHESYRKLESTERRPELHNLRQICLVLKVSADELLGLPTAEPQQEHSTARDAERLRPENLELRRLEYQLEDMPPRALSQLRGFLAAHEKKAARAAKKRESSATKR